MISRQATKRLKKEYRNLQNDPPPYITAKPNEENILEWHYIITGPPDTPFEGGQYHGILRFVSEYPFKPPSILMITPNGRFASDTRLCLTISDFHPESWNPSWSVESILTGLLSFMNSDEITTGSIQSSESVKRKLANASKEWNAKENVRFKKEFPNLVLQNLKDIEQQNLLKKMNSEKEKKGQEIPIDLLKNLDKLDPEERARLRSFSEPHTPDIGPSFPKNAIIGISFGLILAIYLKFFI